MGYIAAQSAPGQTVFTPEPDKATKDLGPLAGDIDTVIRASRAGRAGNDIKVTITGDGGSGVRITESGNDIIILYQSGVSTVGTLETALGAGSAMLEVATAGTGATVLTAPGDDIAEFSLAGGNDLSSGVCLVSQHGTRLTGEGLYSGILSDGTAEACILCPYPPTSGDGRAVDRLVVEDLTLDANGYENCIAALYPACRSLVVRRCVLRGASVAQIYKTGGELIVEDCDFYGTPGAPGITLSLAVKATITNCRFFGGGGGIICAADGYVKEVHTRNCTFEFDYWAAPASQSLTVESATATGLVLNTAPTAIIKSYDVIRVLAQLETGIAVDLDEARIEIGDLTHTPDRWDRWEGPDGEWSQVVELDDDYIYLGPWRRSGTWEPAETPELATAYRVTLGRSSTENAVATPLAALSVERWRKVEGEPASVPAVSARVDLVQRQTEHTDVGALHYTAGCRQSSVVGCLSRGGYADQFSVRGRNNLVTGCKATMGQDMGFTLDPDDGYAVTLTGCEAHMSGVHGVVIGDAERGMVYARGNVARMSGRNVPGSEDVVLVGYAIEWDGEYVNSEGDRRPILPRDVVNVYEA